MVSASLPLSALNWSTALRRLPLPRPPSAKVLGVSVAGTQRPASWLLAKETALPDATAGRTPAYFLIPHS
jgi:hypothetical protein